MRDQNYLIYELHKDQEQEKAKAKGKDNFDEFGSPEIAIKLEIDHENHKPQQFKKKMTDQELEEIWEDAEEHNQRAYKKLMQEQKNDEKKKQQTDFEKKLRTSKEEGNHWEHWKGFGKESTTGQKGPSSTASHPNYSQEGGLLFERISGSSSGLLEDRDLAEDMGIFSFNLDAKGNKNVRKQSPDIFSPNTR